MLCIAFWLLILLEEKKPRKIEKLPGKPVALPGKKKRHPPENLVDAGGFFDLCAGRFSPLCREEGGKSKIKAKSDQKATKWLPKATQNKKEGYHNDRT